MQTNRNSTWRNLTLLAITALLIAACGGDEEPTPAPTTASATATTAPTATTAAATDTPEAASAPESPLAQPESPLAQPESPLTTAPAAPTPLPNYPKSEEEALALAAETTPPDPIDGHGALGGVVYSFGNNRAVYGTNFYLTPAEEVDGEFVPPEIYFGPKEENGDIIGQTNELGQFQLDNVPPGNYYFMLWTVYNWLSTFDAEESAEPILIEIKDGDQVDLGVIYANWP